MKKTNDGWYEFNIIVNSSDKKIKEYKAWLKENTTEHCIFYGLNHINNSQKYTSGIMAVMSASVSHLIIRIKDENEAMAFKLYTC